jgi:lipoprotein-anchoring transpeptidase ErfK/SrfK
MADYHPLLSRAIASLDPPDDAARRQVYLRARTALTRQMRANGAFDDEIEREVDSFDDVVARIESEFAPQVRAPLAPRPAAVSRAPVAGERDAAVAARRRIPVAAMAIGALAAVIAAGVLAYIVAVRDRAAPPAPIARAQTPKTPAGPTAAPKGQTVVVDAAEAPYTLRRQRVFYRTTHPPGTIVVSRSQKFLYLVQPNHVAIRYAIGTGPDCENLTGLFRITEKLSVPAAAQPATPAPRPPAFRLSDQFGPRAVYFDGSHAVHGAADPHQVGGSASVGCFLSWKPDIVDLYDRVQLNDRVVVAN